MELITRTYVFLMFFSFSFTTVIELSLHVDLAMTLTRPFSSAEKRVKLGILLATLYSIIVVIAIFITDFDVTAYVN